MIGEQEFNFGSILLWLRGEFLSSQNWTTRWDGRQRDSSLTLWWSQSAASVFSPPLKLKSEQRFPAKFHRSILSNMKSSRPLAKLSNGLEFMRLAKRSYLARAGVCVYGIFVTCSWLCWSEGWWGAFSRQSIVLKVIKVLGLWLEPSTRCWTSPV